MIDPLVTQLMLIAGFGSIQKCSAGKTRNADERALAGERSAVVDLGNTNSLSCVFDNGVIAILKEGWRCPYHIQNIVIVTEALVEFLRDGGKVTQRGR